VAFACGSAACGSGRRASAGAWSLRKPPILILRCLSTVVIVATFAVRCDVCDSVRRLRFPAALFTVTLLQVWFEPDFAGAGFCLRLQLDILYCQSILTV
jgi:hypothetical protein